MNASNPPADAPIPTIFMHFWDDCSEGGNKSEKGVSSGFEADSEFTSFYVFIVPANLTVETS